jgi:hypothetical protein
LLVNIYHAGHVHVHGPVFGTMTVQAWGGGGGSAAGGGGGAYNTVTLSAGSLPATVTVVVGAGGGNLSLGGVGGTIGFGIYLYAYGGGGTVGSP